MSGYFTKVTLFIEAKRLTIGKVSPTDTWKNGRNVTPPATLYFGLQIILQFFVVLLLPHQSQLAHGKKKAHCSLHTGLNWQVVLQVKKCCANSKDFFWLGNHQKNQSLDDFAPSLRLRPRRKMMARRRRRKKLLRRILHVQLLLLLLCALLHGLHASPSLPVDPRYEFLLLVHFLHNLKPLVVNQEGARSSPTPFAVSWLVTVNGLANKQLTNRHSKRG